MSSVSVHSPVSSAFQAPNNKALPRKEQLPAYQAMPPQPGYFNTDALLNMATGTLVPAFNSTVNTVIPFAQQYGQQYAPTPQELGKSIAWAAIPYSGEALALRSAYGTISTEFKKTEDLPIKERSKKLATKAGDVALFTLLGTFALPALMATHVNRWVEKALTKPRIPVIMKRNPKVMTVLALGAIGAVAAKPMNALVNFVLDWTYRPMVEEKRRKEFLAAQADFKKKAVAYQDSMKRSTPFLRKELPTDMFEQPVAARGA